MVIRIGDGRADERKTGLEITNNGFLKKKKKTTNKTLKYYTVTGLGDYTRVTYVPGHAPYLCLSALGLGHRLFRLPILPFYLLPEGNYTRNST